MLILTRKKEQSISINENTEITILEIDGANVKIGISAPNSVRILRSELTKDIKVSNEQATHQNTNIIKKMIKKLTESK
ncbi:MAG: carbon storage regulator [Campylobacter sp.]|nr:carbon storage regulator [Campylobacter sp.]